MAEVVKVDYPAINAETGFGAGPIDHVQFVISNQIKFHFIKIYM